MEPLSAPTAYTPWPVPDTGRPTDVQRALLFRFSIGLLVAKVRANDAGSPDQRLDVTSRTDAAWLG